MAELKTRPGEHDVQAFLAAVKDEGRRRDAGALCEILARVTGEPPVMWGSSIVGFGSRKLRYDDGRVTDWMAIGFSPRSANLALYPAGPLESYADLLEQLGPHKTGKGCLYLKRLADADVAALESLVARSLELARSS